MPDAVPPAPPAPATPTPPQNGVTPPVASPADAKPPETPPSPKEGKLLEQIRAREKRFVEEQQRAKQESERERHRLQQERAQIDADRQAIARERAEREERERAALGQKDPLRWFQEEQSRALHEQNRKIAELEGKLAKQDAALLERDRTSAIDRELTKLHTDAKASTERPHVAKLAEKAPTRFRNSSFAIAQEHYAQGVSLTNDEILDKLEEQLAEEASLWTDSGKPVTSADTATPKPGPTPSPADPSLAPSLSNARTGERSSEMSADEMSKLSLEERRKRTLAQLAEMRAARKAAAAGK